MATVKEIQDDYNNQIADLNLLLTKVPGGLNEQLKNVINNADRLYIENIYTNLKGRGLWNNTLNQPSNNSDLNFAWIDSTGNVWYGEDSSEAFRNANRFMIANKVKEIETKNKINDINAKIIRITKALDSFNTSLSKTPQAIQALATINNNAEIELKKLQTKRIIFIILGLIAIGLVIFFIIKYKKKNA